jgi:hypothetical protein
MLINTFSRVSTWNLGRRCNLYFCLWIRNYLKNRSFFCILFIFCDITIMLEFVAYVIVCKLKSGEEKVKKSKNFNSVKLTIKSSRIAIKTGIDKKDWNIISRSIYIFHTLVCWCCFVCILNFFFTTWSHLNVDGDSPRRWWYGGEDTQKKHFL